MIDQRIGNDIKVDWYITRKDGQAFSLEGLDVSLYLKSMFGRKPLSDFVITGNIIQWTFYGKDQKSVGAYSLEMVVNEGEKGMITTDACDFVNLVSCSCLLEGGKDEDGVDTQTIVLESRVDVSSGEVVTIVVDSFLSETSVNPVENRVITAEFKKKADKTEIPTKLSQLEQDIEIGGDVDLSDYVTKKEFSDSMERYALADDLQELSERVDGIEGGGSGSAATPDWNASEGEEGFIKNRTHYKKESVDVYGLKDVYWDEDNDRYSHSFSIEVGRDKEIDRISFSYNDIESEDIIISDTEIDFETSINVNSKETYDFQGYISIYDAGKYKGIHITAYCESECFGLRANIKYLTLVQLSDEFIPNSIARKSELTELSTEVGGLSERVDELEQGGQGGADEILRVEYGVTTFQEIYDAYNEGKYIVFEYANNVFHINRVTATDIYFVSINGTIGYRVGVNQQNNWYQNTYQNEQSTNKVTSLSDKSTDTQYPSAKAVYDALQQSGGGGGTPSGDPMHYMYEAVGATYNATDADIPMVGIYGDSYVHKAHHWCLGEVGDLTNEEIREIYALTNPFRRRNVLECTFADSTIRTNLPIWDSDNIGFGSFNKSRTLMNGLAYRARGLEVFNYVSPNVPINSNTNKYNGISEASMFLYQAQKLKKVLGVLDFTYVANAVPENSFRDCTALEELRIHSLKASITIKYSPRLSNASILYMIENATATGITITLHADAYDRAMADSAITAAMESKQVNLAKA